MELAARLAHPIDANQTYAPALFSTGWFVESLMTQTLIVHIIRTNQIPFLHSPASWQVTLTTLAIMGIGLWLPFSPLAQYLGFVPLPWPFWPLLAATLIGYMDLTLLIKGWNWAKGGFEPRYHSGYLDRRNGTVRAAPAQCES